VLHIGKSSHGWKFSFQGYRNEYCEPRIVSWADWQRVICQPHSRILDEYGESETADGFRRMVEEKQNAKLGGSDVAMRANAGDTEAQKIFGPYWDMPSALERYWIDPEGYQFQEGEFS
jgi:hypothetical protein